MDQGEDNGSNIDNNNTIFINSDDFSEGSNLPSAFIKPSIEGGIDELFDKMSEEDAKIRNMMLERKAAAAEKDKELQSIITALKKNGYDDGQINEIFNSGLLTRDVINSLISFGN